MASTVSTSSAFIAGTVVSDQSLFFEALRDPGYAAYVGYSDRRPPRSPLPSSRSVRLPPINTSSATNWCASMCVPGGAVCG